MSMFGVPYIRVHDKDRSYRVYEYMNFGMIYSEQEKRIRVPSSWRLQLLQSEG